MDEIQLHPFVFSALISFLLLWFITKLFYKPNGNKKIPPSPLKLPILGNLHQIGSLAHHDLRFLAQKHGPIMLLHFGSAPVLIVSSAEVAREIMKTHDLIFPSRPQYKIHKKLLYNCKDVTFSQYGEYWRQLKSILVLQLLSNKRVQSFRTIRDEETNIFLKKIGEKTSSAVNLTKMFSELTNIGVCRSAFGRKYGDSEDGKKFMMLMVEFLELFGAISIGEFIPWLGWITRVNGFDSRVDKVAKGIDDFLDGVIQEHQTTGKNEENFLDILLDIHNTDATISRDSIKAIVLSNLRKRIVPNNNMFEGCVAAGTDTNSTVLDWAMTELLRHPAVMEKLQSQIREVLDPKKDITDDDVEKMHYLKAVIKETLRLHPPVPLLIPRVANTDVKVKGYDILVGTVVMINAWAIGRDPESWDDPEKFYPERFLNSSIDFRGFDFELIPFGAGRRGCPGITFAVATIEFVLANLVRKFNWKLPMEQKGKIWI